MNAEPQDLEPGITLWEGETMSVVASGDGRTYPCTWVAMTRADADALAASGTLDLATAGPLERGDKEGIAFDGCGQLIGRVIGRGELTDRATWAAMSTLRRADGLLVAPPSWSLLDSKGDLN